MTDAELLKIACEIARQDSQDLRTQNAAILVRRSPSGDVAGSVWAANHFPRGVSRVHEPPGKYERIEHAERAVIYAAAKTGWRTHGTVMYVPWLACPDCARAIVLAGVTEVVGLESLSLATPARWRQAVLVGQSILREAGVLVRFISETVGATLRFDGDEVLL